MNTEPEPYPYSLPPRPFPTLPLSTLTKASERVSVSVATSSSQTKVPSRTSNSTGSTRSVPVAKHQQRGVSNQARNPPTETMSRATSGTLESVPSVHLSAGTSTSAQTVARTTGQATASQSGGTLEPHAKHPRYTRGLLWDQSDDTLSATVHWSVTTDPVPMVPACKGV